MGGVNSINPTTSNGYVSSYSQRTLNQKVKDFFKGTSSLIYYLNDLKEIKEKKNILQEILLLNLKLKNLNEYMNKPIENSLPKLA